MALKIAINGFGRIGRCVLRAIYERNLQNTIEVVAINELADCETISYMLRYDSTHGRFPCDVSVQSDCLTVTESGLTTTEIAEKTHKIKILHQAQIENLDWDKLGVDVVLECTGQFKSHGQLSAHITQGAKKVLLSAPGEADVDYTLINGVNESGLNGGLDSEHKIISLGSCSTNAVLPIMVLLDELYGIEKGVSTTIHSAMNDQPVIDAYASDLRKTRAAVTSIIPIDTALPKGISRIMPQLDGKIESIHLRVPTLNVSAMDLTLQLNKPCDVDDINNFLDISCNGKLKDLIGFTKEPHASVDFNHDSRSGIVDGTQTKVSGGNLLKLLVWFDNEWAFANRMVDGILRLKN